MKACIYELDEARGAGALDLAGRPLLTRQLQWLRELGIEEVAVEIADGPLAVACAELLLGHDPLTAHCVVIPTRAPVGPRELARRAELAPDEVFLALPANIVAKGVFPLPTTPTEVALAVAPFALDERPVTLTFCSLRALDRGARDGHAQPLVDDAESGETRARGTAHSERGAAQDGRAMQAGTAHGALRVAAEPARAHGAPPAGGAVAEPANEHGARIVGSFVAGAATEHIAYEGGLAADAATDHHARIVGEVVAEAATDHDAQEGGLVAEAANERGAPTAGMLAAEAAQEHETPGAAGVLAAEAARDGWGLTLSDPATAHTLSCAAIAGQAPGLMIHAAEVKPGVWYARGARVAEDATLVAPVLVGPDARVFARARLGPNVIIGRHAVIERDAVLSEVSIAPATLVGEGARLRQAYVDPSGYSSFVDGARTEVRDPLLLSSAQPTPLALGARLLALGALLLLLVPWSALALVSRLLGRRPLAARPFRGAPLLEGTLGLPLLDVFPRLCDVLLGRRSLLGLSESTIEQIAGRHDGARPAALALDAALAPHSPETQRCMARWYLLNKSFEIDRQLLWERIRTRAEPPPGGAESRSF